MTLSDDEPRHIRPGPKDLSPLGIAELEIYIAELQSEIGRARAAIEAKRGHLSGAEALFKR